MKVGDTPHVKMEKLIDSSDVPDSATTLRDPIFHDIKIDDDQHIKTAADDIEPPQNILSLGRSSPSNSDEKVDKHVDAGLIERETSQAKHIWKFRLRPVDDDEPE